MNHDYLSICSNIEIQSNLSNNIYSKFSLGPIWSAGIGLKSPVKFNTQVFGRINTNGKIYNSHIKIGCDLEIKTVLNNGNKLEIEYNRSSFLSSAKETAIVSISPIISRGNIDLYPIKLGISLTKQNSWMNPTTRLYMGTNFEL
jgi:hypothetical protein